MRRLEAPAIFLFVLSAALLLALLFCRELILPAEMAAHLSSGALLASGKIPYRDFFDNLSPGLLFFSMLPAFFAPLKLHPILVYKLGVFVLFILSSALVFKIAGSGSFRLSERAALYFVPFCTALFLLVFLSSFAHENLLFSISLLPYLLLRLGRPSLPLQSRQFALSFLLFLIATAVDPSFFGFYLLFELSLLFLPGAKFDKQFVVSALLSPLAYLLVLAVLPSEILKNYIERVVLVNLATFLQFNEYLYWMEKSPDRRDLIYVFVAALTLSTFALGVSRLARSFVVLSAIGFAYYLSTVGLLTGAALPMLYFAMLASLVALSRALCAVSCKWKLPDMLVLTNKKVLGASTLLVLVVSFTLFFRSPFSLAPLGYHLWGRKWDVSYFSSVVEKYSEPGERVAVFSFQARPGYPLLTQLARPNGSAFIYFYPFLVFRHMEMLPDWHRAALAPFEPFIWSEIAREFKENPAELVLVAEGDIMETFDRKGLRKLLDEKYDHVADCTMMSSTEALEHAPFEYLGYQDAFAVFKLREK